MIDEESGGGPSRLVLVAPVLVIVAALAYLFLRNPSTNSLVKGAATPTPTPASARPTLPPIPTSTPVPTPTPKVLALIERIPAHKAGFLLDEPMVAASTAIEVGEQSLNAQQPAAWASGPPRIEFVSADGNEYRFRADGFQSGEVLLLDRSDLVFNLGGHVTKPRGAVINAAGGDPTGIDLTVHFNPNSATTFGPSFQLAVRGTLGSVATGTAAYVHYGREPPGTLRLDEAIENIWYQGPFKMYLPRDLPRGSRVQWTGHSRFGSGFLWNWVLTRPDGGWQALVMIEKSGCDAQRGAGARTLFECFGDIIVPPDASERLPLNGYDWHVGQGGSEWAATGDIEGTLVLFVSATREAVVRAAASTHP